MVEVSQPVHVEGREIGALIGGAFGTVFVAVNSTAMTVFAHVAALLVAGCLLAAILLLSLRNLLRWRAASEDATADATRQHGNPFGWRYWTIVGIEAVALFGGARVITALGHPELGIAWVAVVVGTHFFALARIFRLTRFHVLGAIVTALGALGFLLGALGEVDAIALVSGVLSGFALLAFGLAALLPPHPRKVQRAAG